MHDSEKSVRKSVIILIKLLISIARNVWSIWNLWRKSRKRIKMKSFPYINFEGKWRRKYMLGNLGTFSGRILINPLIYTSTPTLLSQSRSLHCCFCNSFCCKYFLSPGTQDKGIFYKRWQFPAEIITDFCEMFVVFSFPDIS